MRLVSEQTALECPDEIGRQRARAALQTEPSWRPAGCNRWHPVANVNAPERAQTTETALPWAATERLRRSMVRTGSTVRPSEGSTTAPEIGAFSFSSTCSDSNVRWVWSRLWSSTSEDEVVTRWSGASPAASRRGATTRRATAHRHMTIRDRFGCEPYRCFPAPQPEPLFRGSELVEPQHEFLDLG